jgi:hypothetical protein
MSPFLKVSHVEKMAFLKSNKGEYAFSLTRLPLKSILA